ncbi:PEPTIDYL-PROLYL CIS-TRANS ISOMERASE [Salix koriyanagi]|uniref:peptidylprolyl isomerase n=1 Tax=Salix koriyanagi TaxID=2511006 RepID=A0A9Q0X3U9_9ROSI|nr:PEPTIDYL-PROLYL CIS-TRANS ISOMERASE [Salix koriyanagi]
MYHCTVRTLAGVVVESTRSEYGGKGTAIRQVLGKSKMLLGLLEGLPTMLKGEVAMFKMKPQMHYSEVDCPVSPPSSFPKDDELHFEIEMIDFSKVKVVSDDLGVIKKVIDDGQGWESPREPYEVKAWISAKTGDDKVILSPKQGEPYFFTIGKSEVPKGLEMGIGTMTREEKAVIYVTNQYLTESPLMSVVEGFEEVQFEVELIHFIPGFGVFPTKVLVIRNLLYFPCISSINVYSLGIPIAHDIFCFWFPYWTPHYLSIERAFLIIHF